MTKLTKSKLCSICAFISIAFAVVPQLSIAQSIEYDVEIIIFENARQTRVGASDTLLLPVVNNAQPIPQTPLPGAAIQPIGELRLLSEVEKIKGSANHQLLFHGGWRQAALDKESAPYVSIALGRSFNLFSEPVSIIDDNEDENENQFLRAYLTPPLDSEFALQQARSATLFGAVKVWVGRFLHFETHLAYTPSGADFSYAFNSQRRMRSRQTHYIDNSRVGIITKIFPVDNSAPN